MASELQWRKLALMCTKDNGRMECRMVKDGRSRTTWCMRGNGRLASSVAKENNHHSTKLMKEALLTMKQTDLVH